MLKDKSISPHQIIFDSAITRIEVDTYTSYLWITHNDEEDSIHFSKISLENKPNQKKLDFIFKKEHFVLNSVWNDFIIMSKINDPGKPEENEFCIIDAESQDIVEYYKGYRFTGFINEFTLQMEKPGFEMVKLEEVDLSKYRNESAKEKTKILQPQLFLPKNELFDSVKSFMSDELQAEIIAPVEMLEYNQNIFASVHRREEDSFTKLLVIINNEGKIIFQAKLYEKLQKRVPDSFFVSGKFLIFVSRFNILNLLNIDSHNAS